MLNCPTCEEVPDKILLKLSGELDEAAQAPLRAHLEACPACRAQAEVLGESWEAFRRPPLWKAAPLSFPFPRRDARPLAWAAAGLLLALALGWRTPPRQSPRMTPIRFGAPYATAVDLEMQDLFHRCEESWRDMSLAESGMDRNLESLSDRITTLSKEISSE